MADWGQAILLTVAQIRALGGYATPPAVTGLDYIDTDYQHVLHAGAGLNFRLDQDSAIAHGHDPTDLRIIQRVPGVDQSSCDSSAEIDWPGVQFAFAGEKGIYGNALANTDWSNSNGTDPDGNGAFTVSSTAAILSLNLLPCNYGWLCDDIPNQNFPTGMPGAPEMCMYHRHDLWRAYDGELGQDLVTTYNIPAEAVWCWRGYPCLKLAVTGVGVSGILTVRVCVVHHHHRYPHVSGSRQQTDYTHGESREWLEYQLSADDDGVIYLGVPINGIEPDLEQIERIEISGWAEGNCSISEPLLAADPVASRLRVKAFEGPLEGYRHGGLSAVNSPSHKYQLLDMQESNSGHANLREWTARFFEHITGDVSGEDLTTAYGLASYAGLLNSVCDAWAAALNDTAYDAATLDDESPPNRLSTCWGFDICWPDCTAKAPRPLTQDVGTHLNCSLRCGSWTMAAGIVYAVRTDKVIGGGIHGLAVDTDRDIVRQGSVQIWRQTPGETAWTDAGTVPVDQCGMWWSGNCTEVHPDTGARYMWGISAPGATAPEIVIGIAPLREYVDAGILFPIEITQPSIDCDALGRLWLVALLNGDVRAWRMASLASPWESLGVVLPGNYDRPRVHVGRALSGLKGNLAVGPVVVTGYDLTTEEGHTAMWTGEGWQILYVGI